MSAGHSKGKHLDMPKRMSLRLAEKKNRREEVKGQEVEERKVKRPKIDEGSSEQSICTLDFNPFLVEPILRKLLKKVDTVAQLKDLRKMCVLWDNVDIEELEERAFKGKLKAIDFQWTNRWNTKKLAVKELIQFMKDTRSISRLFRSFKFNIPESLKILQGHTSEFFSNYHIYRVELLMPDDTDFEEFQPGSKYILSMIGPNLKDIKICQPNAWYGHVSFDLKSPKWPKPQQKIVLPKLEKLIIEKCWDDQLTEFFKAALGTGSGHITSLALPSLPGADIGSFPGLDPTRMTRLDIGGFKGSSIALKYTTGLMTLVEKGMRLLDLGLKLDSGGDTPVSLAQNLPSICFNLTQFFATQSSTLATLDLFLEFYCSWPGSEDEIGPEVSSYSKIQLPIFQALHTLSFHHRLEIKIANQDYRMLAFSLLEITHSLPLHFPSLVNVTFDSEGSMGVFFVNPDPMEMAEESRFHFKRLEILQESYAICLDLWNKESRGNWNMLYGSLIGSVDYLKVPRAVLQEVRIPWGDSLRELVTEFVSAPFKLAHLKKLQKLVIEDYRRVGIKPTVREPISGESSDSESDSDSDNYEIPVEEYLSWFKEAKQLSLTYIKFIGLKVLEKGAKQKFNRYFPYPVIFEN